MGQLGHRTQQGISDLELMRENLKKLKLYLYKKILEFDHYKIEFFEYSAEDVESLVDEIDKEDYEAIRNELDVLEAMDRI